ncbi:MAG: hypothetical protein B7Z35_11795 [Hydrogenophilales bacterium 12-61-10]|nr:MAG: hypothetical protein B7Z35_11795 [Hydrogenophilales bacterium 12-61-10]OYX32398.1 MAG: hypothetical protein B7Z03_02015 [Hydrogenophilales bacterium 32-62-9]
MFKEVNLAFVMALILFAAPVHASEISPENTHDIQTLVELVGVQNLAEALLSAELKRHGAPKSEHAANVQKKKLIRVNPKATAIMVEMMLAPGGVVDLLIPIYGKYYSPQEIRGLINFFQPGQDSFDVNGFHASPLGKKKLNVEPLLQTDSMKAAVEWSELHDTEIKRRISLSFLSEGALPVLPANPALARCPIGETDLTYYPANQLDVHPWVMSKIAPEYPKAASENGLSGSVKVEINVDENGQVQRLRTINSTPPGVFDQSVMDAFRKADFQPACRNGFAVRSVIHINVQFDFDAPP